MIREKEVPPDPKRVIEGLRDTGYEFPTAIADIVDNSLAAEATLVKIQADMEVDGCITVSIADNGTGMNEEDLINAMRYGSQTKARALSLGKFGLGLKTGSTAFCRMLSVVTKDIKSTDYHKATWDLDHVAKVGKWALQLPTPAKEEIAYLQKVAGTNSGTLVIWEKVDRLIKQYVEPGGPRARTHFDRAIESLKEMLPMIYQRFLDPDYPGAPKVEIFVNGEKLEPWNPFFPQESQLVGKDTVEITNENHKTLGFVNVAAYVLPRKEDFSSGELAKNARISNEYQGIYVYRENRLIYGPDWMGLYSKESHMTLLRIDFSFGHELDEAFHIDIKKSQVIPDEVLKDWLEEKFLPAPRRAAEQESRKGERAKINQQARSIHASSNKAIASKADDVTESRVETVGKGEVQVTNLRGTARLQIKTSEPSSPDEIYVKPVDSIYDGLLWQPVVMKNKVAVEINTGHEYYSKVYIPNKNSSVIIQGLDSLLWALSQAEMDTINLQNQKYFIELRYHLSKILRQLAAILPDPET